MYLKRLEIQGFKSFQGRTLFEFGPGITAIVGPNGSGKSNIAESIRWVLGEHSARHLRAKRLEDVIFSGSSQKAAVGMAEVAITLDNGDGWLPVDFSEVVVARRAYRNGESEYLINKARVRLRDVQDLLLRAQVGQNSYAFMGQGLVDEVLVMRPEERRRLLEEAADVRLLRARLDEARDRLAATRENLERVQLLLEEIGPRLQQLERQASRAIEHARLASELRSTLRELYSRQWAEGQEALALARARWDQKQQELLDCRREVQACEEGLQALSAALEEREKEVNERRLQQRALSDQLHALEQQILLDRERLDSQLRRRAELEAELQSLRDERLDLQHSFEGLQERSRAIQPEIEEARALIASRRQELSAFEQEQSALRRRLAESQETLNRARRGISECDADLARLQQEEERSRAEVVRRENRRRQLIASLAELGAEFRQARQALAEAERDLAVAEQERSVLSGIQANGRALLQRLEAEAAETEAALNQLLLRQELLRRLQTAQEGIEAGPRRLLGASDDSASASQPAPGLIGLVRDLLRVPPGLELAIEAALAENEQALVFETLDDAVAALAQLHEQQAGRALVYALDHIRAVPPLNLLRERGVLGVAARLVRYDNRFRPLVDALLGRTIVVEGYDLAQQVLRRGLGSVATTEGVLLRPNGAIAGGIRRSSADAFSRQRELDELPAEIARWRARKSDADAVLRRERGEVNAAVAALAELEPRLQSLRSERARRQNALMENRGRLILLRSEARGLWAELRRGQVFNRQDRAARLLGERERLEAEAQKAGSDLQACREALARVSARRTAAVDAVSEAAAAHAALEGEARSLARQLEQLQAALGRLDGQLRTREESLRAIDQDTAAVRKRSDEAASRLGSMRVELEGLTSEMSPAEEELSHLAGRERSLRDQLAAARTRLLEAERASLEAEAALKLRGDEIEALRDMLASEGFLPQGSRVVEAAAEAGPGSSQRGGRLPPVRGAAEVSITDLRTRAARLRNQIRSLGPINEQAEKDYGESKERYDFLKGQVDDLQGSEQTLLAAIADLEESIRQRLQETFAVVDGEFQRYFQAFFNGGNARLLLTQPDDYANSGIDILAQPPGKRVNSLAMLSGGERALTALALLFSLLEAHPSPICVLDEVDAALDETNVGRFVEALRALAKKTQFIIITHNPRTVEAADAIYGVSMGSDNTSRVLSLRLDPPSSPS